MPIFIVHLIQLLALNTMILKMTHKTKFPRLGKIKDLISGFSWEPGDLLPRAPKKIGSFFGSPGEQIPGLPKIFGFSAFYLPDSQNLVLWDIFWLIVFSVCS